MNDISITFLVLLDSSSSFYWFKIFSTLSSVSVMKTLVVYHLVNT